MKQRGSVFFFFLFLSPTGSARLLFVCQGFLLPLLYDTVFLSFLLPKNSSSATEDTQDLLTSLWPLVGIEGSRHFGFGLGGSGVALRHVVLFVFYFRRGLTHARSAAVARTDTGTNPTQTRLSA